MLQTLFGYVISVVIAHHYFNTAVNLKKNIISLSTNIQKNYLKLLTCDFLFNKAAFSIYYSSERKNSTMYRTDLSTVNMILKFSGVTYAYI